MHSRTGQSHDPTARVNHARRLAELLDRQRELFRELDALSLRQGECVRAGSSDDLLRVLGERQRVVERLDEAACELAPYRERWDETLAHFAEHERRTLRACLEETTTIAARVAARDDADRKELESRRTTLADELAGVSRVRGAVSAYAPRAAQGARFQDREG